MAKADGCCRKYLDGSPRSLTPLWTKNFHIPKPTQNRSTNTFLPHWPTLRIKWNDTHQGISTASSTKVNSQQMLSLVVFGQFNNFQKLKETTYIETQTSISSNSRFCSLKPKIHDAVNPERTVSPTDCWVNEQHLLSCYVAQKDAVPGILAHLIPPPYSDQSDSFKSPQYPLQFLNPSNGSPLRRIKT